MQDLVRSSSKNMTEELNSECTIFDLPEEILLRIFSSLSKKDLVLSVRETCRLWQTISYEKSLWKQLVLCPDFQNQKHLRQIIEILLPVQDYVEEIVMKDIDDETVDLVFLDSNINFRNLRKVCFDYKNSDVYIFISFIDKHGTSLEEITHNNFDTSKFLVQSFFSIFTHTPKLHKFCVKNSDYENDLGNIPLYEVFKVAWDGEDAERNKARVDSTFTDLANLESFISRGSICFPKYHVCDTFVELLLKNCPHLKTLEIDHAKYVSSSAFENLTSPCDIERLGISHTLVDDQGIKHIANVMPKLRYLNIEGCMYLTDVGLAHVSENCPYLEEIIISGGLDKNGSNITSGALHKLSLDCPQLKSISLCQSLQINDSGIIALGTNCAALTSINVRGCTSVTDRSVIALSENCKQLQEVFIDECAHLTSASINSLLLNCRKIHTLHASTCHQISSINLEPFEKIPNMLDCYFPEKSSDFKCTCFGNHHGNVENITDLRCNDEEKINDDVAFNVENKQTCLYCRMSEGRRNFLRALQSEDVPDFKVCSSIRDLNLDLCSKLGNDSMMQLAKYCPDLRKISLNGCFKVTDLGIQCLLKHCKYVQHLEVSNLSTLQKSRLTDTSLEAVVEYGHNLRALFIERVSSITPEGVQALRSKSNSLQELYL